VTTGSGAYAEIMLNPGSYLRLGPESAFRFVSTSLDDLKVELSTGTAIFEVYANDKFDITIDVPRGALVLDQTGVYRINIDGGSSLLQVIEGRAVVGTTAVKAGRSVILDGNAVPAKFDREDRDAFAEWSRTRARDIAKATNSLKAKALSNALATSFASRNWSFGNSFGLWILDASWPCGLFLPFGYNWYSPYGFYLGSPFDWYRYRWDPRGLITPVPNRTNISDQPWNPYQVNRPSNGTPAGGSPIRPIGGGMPGGAGPANNPGGGIPGPAREVVDRPVVAPGRPIDH